MAQPNCNSTIQDQDQDHSSNLCETHDIGSMVAQFLTNSEMGAGGTSLAAALLTHLLTPELRREMMGSLLKTLVNHLIDAEFTERLKAGRYERTPERTGQRNGTRPSTITVRDAGITTTVDVPKLRKGTFHPEVLDKVKGLTEQALATVVPELYISGVSTRRVGHLLETLGLQGVSSATVSNMCKPLDEMVAKFRMRPLTQRYPVVYVDATNAKFFAMAKSRGQPIGLPWVFASNFAIANAPNRAGWAHT